MLDEAVRWVLSRLAEACTPRPKLSLAEWAEANIVIGAESNSPRTGPLKLTGVEYILAALEALDPEHAARIINILASAQSGKSLVGQIKAAHTIAENPGPIGVYLPSLDDAKKWAEEKIDAIVKSSPALKHRVRDVSSRSNEGSSALRKRFVGGSMRIATASSPNALQLVSFRDLILEEVAGYETDVGGRGSPIAQARKRQAAWETSGAKTLMISAAGVDGECPSTTAHTEGTGHEIYLPCPHCSGFNRFEWEDMHAPTETFGAHFVCRLCGGVVEDKHKPAMVKGHCWVPCFAAKDDEPPPRAFEAADRERWEGRDVGARQPSFRWWLFVSPFATWDLIWSEGQDAKKAGLAAEKTFHQQTLARAWDEGREAPDHEVLYGLREESYGEGEVPAGAYLLTGMVDVQGDRLHWAVYAWGPGAEWWLVARDVLMGDPSGDDVWNSLVDVLKRDYPHAEGGRLAPYRFGVDSGFKTSKVYEFCSRHHVLGARALDGRSGWRLPYIGKPRVQKIKIDGRLRGRVKLYPTGTWSLKSELQFSLREAIKVGLGVRRPGRGHFHAAVSEDYVRELVAEVLVEETVRGQIVHAWKLRAGWRNEETDCWVGARALAFAAGVGLTGAQAFDFAAARERIVGEKQQDMFDRVEIVEDNLRNADLQAALRIASGGPPPVSPPASGWTPKHKFAKANV